MVVLMSIHLKYIEKIKQRKKIYEFRRKYPLREEALSLIYVPRPIKGIILWILFGKPIVGNPNELLKLSEYSSPHDRLSLIKYLEGVEKGFAIPILKFGEIYSKISLEEMGRYGVVPPQHMIYLDRFPTFLDMVCQRSREFSILYSKSNNP